MTEFNTKIVLDAVTKGVPDIKAMTAELKSLEKELADAQKALKKWEESGKNKSGIAWLQDDVDKLNVKVKAAKAGLDEASRSTEAFGTNLNSLAAVTAIAVAGFAALAKSYTVLGEKAMEVEDRVNRTRVMFGDLADEVIQRGELMSAASRNVIDDEEIIDAMNRVKPAFDALGLTYEQLIALTEKATDFATTHAMSVDEAMGIFQQGLAGQGRALKQYGILLEDSQDPLKSYGQIMLELDRYQGAAAKSVETLTGKQKQLTNTLDDAKRALAEEYSPSLKEATDLMTTLAIVTSEKVIPALTSYVGWILDNATPLSSDRGPIRWFAELTLAMESWVSKVPAATAAAKELRGAMSAPIETGQSVDLGMLMDEEAGQSIITQSFADSRQLDQLSMYNPAADAARKKRDDQLAREAEARAKQSEKEEKERYDREINAIVEQAAAEKRLTQENADYEANLQREIDDDYSKRQEEANKEFVDSWQRAQDIADAIISKDWGKIGLVVGDSLMRSLSPEAMNSLGGFLGLADENGIVSQEMGGALSGVGAQALSFGATALTSSGQERINATSAMAGTVAGGALGASFGPAGAMIGASLGGVVGTEIGKVFGGSDGARVKVTNASEIVEGIQEALGMTGFGGKFVSMDEGKLRDAERSRLWAEAMSQGVGDVSLENRDVRLNATGEWSEEARDRIEAMVGGSIDVLLAENERYADALGVTSGKLVEMRSLISIGAEAQALLDAGETGEQLIQNAQAGRAALEEFVGVLEKLQDEWQAGEDAMDEFGRTVDREIATRMGTTGEYLAGEWDRLTTEMNNSASAIETARIAQEMMNVAIQQNAEMVADASQKIRDTYAADIAVNDMWIAALQSGIEIHQTAIDDLKTALDALADSFADFNDVLDDLASAEDALADIESKRADKASEIESLLYRNAGGFGEMDADQKFGAILGQVESLGGAGGAGGDARKAQQLMALLNEAQGTIGTARSQSLIGNEEEASRLTTIGDMFDQLFEAQAEQAKIERDATFASLMGTDFAKNESVFGAGGLQGQVSAFEATAGRPATAEDIRQMSESGFIAEQAKLQEAIAGHQASIDTSTLLIEGFQKATADSTSEMNTKLGNLENWANVILVSQLEALRSKAQTEAKADQDVLAGKINLGTALVMGELGSNSQLATDIHNWLAAAPGGGALDAGQRAG